MNIVHNYPMGFARKFIPLLFLSLPFPLMAQTGTPPLPSGIKATATGAEITLTWLDSPGLNGESYEIRSSLNPFGSRLPEDTVILMRVPENLETVTFLPPDGETRYYAVTLVHGGERFLSFESGRNSLAFPIAADGILVEENRAAVIANFTVTRLEQGAQIRFRTSIPGREIGIFRSTEPFTESSDFDVRTHLYSITPSKENVVWVDRQNDGIPWYYAAADIRLINSGNKNISHFAGIQMQPVIIPWQDKTPRFSRVTPVPVILDDREQDLSGNHGPIPLQTYLRDSSKYNPVTRIPKPVLLETENEQLNFIYRELVLSGDYLMAEKSLEPFILTTELTLEEAEASRFLYSQTLWLLNRREEAFLILLMLNPELNRYPPNDDSGKWLRLIAQPYL